MPKKKLLKNQKEVTQADIIDWCHKSLLAFCKLQNKHYETPLHLKKLSSALVAIERGEINRLIVTMPPRHGKSNLCSEYFPVWYLGKNPHKQIITSTYNQDYANDFGRKVRGLIQNEYTQAIFPELKLRNDTQSVNRLQFTKDGNYFAVGIGGPTTGRGADLFLIDDPHKDRLEADSTTMIKRAVDWFGAVAYTRLMPNAAIVVVMTRWHENDLVGHILKNTKEKWHVINFPAIKEDGTALWPERYGLDDLTRIRSTLSEYDWNSLYMQNPTPREGILFKADMMPQGKDSEYGAYVIGVDPAISEEETADETAACVIGVRYDKGLALDELETVSGRFRFPDQLELISQLYKKYHQPKENKRVVALPVEDIQYQKALIQVLGDRGLPVVPMKLPGSKYLKANYITPLMTQQKVRVNSENLREQMFRFRGKNEDNDRVDAFVLAVTYCKDYEDCGYKRPHNEFEGLTHQEIFVKKYMNKFRKESLGIKELFDEESLNDMSNVDYF